MTPVLTALAAVVGGALFIVMIWYLITYNGFISKENRVKNAFASIDVNLTKRHTLIPNLVGCCEGYMTHERELLEEVTRLRGQAAEQSGAGMAPGRMAVEGLLGGALGRLMIRAEAYPDLKAGENFMHLQRTLTEIEEQISAARRSYNAAVEQFNNACQMIPSSFVAASMGKTTKPYFEAGDDERQAVKVSL